MALRYEFLPINILRKGSLPGSGRSLFHQGIFGNRTLGIFISQRLYFYVRDLQGILNHLEGRFQKKILFRGFSFQSYKTGKSLFNFVEEYFSCNSFNVFNNFLNQFQRVIQILQFIVRHKNKVFIDSTYKSPSHKFFRTILFIFYLFNR